MKASKMRVALVIWICITITSACCSCTEKLCVEDNSEPFSIILGESFDLSEIDSLKIQEYDRDFNYIGDLLVSTNNTEREIRLIPSTLQDSQGALFHSLVLLNISSISQLDTITNLRFSKNGEALKCNDCSGMGNCEDEFYTNITYSDISHSLNGRSTATGKIPIERK